MTLPHMSREDELAYYKKISKIESNDNPKAKAKTSSASGRFQFIKSTWEELGYDFDDVFDDKLQWEAIEKFTLRNAQALNKAGCAINHATLYGSHFLGVTGFLRVMSGSPSDSIATVTSEAQRRANPTILKGTIRDFTDWLRRKTGDDYTKRYTQGGWVAGPGVVVPPSIDPTPVVVEPGFGQPRLPREKGFPWAAILLAVLLIGIFGLILSGVVK